MDDKIDPQTMITDLLMLQAKLSWTQSNALGFMAELQIHPPAYSKKAKADRLARIKGLRDCMGSMSVYTQELGEMLSKFQAHGKKLQAQAGDPS